MKEIEIGGFIAFYILPFIFLTLIIPFLIGCIIKKIGRFQIKYKKIFLLVSVIATLCFIASIIWIKFISNHIYYEWDTILDIVTPVTYESPLIEKTTFFQKSFNGELKGTMGTWLAKGWSQFDLYLLWLGIVAIIYFVVWIVGRFFKSKNERRFVLDFCIISFLISIVLGRFGGVIAYFVAFGSASIVAPIFSLFSKFP